MPFKARIYKAGINPCVDVPPAVTAKMNPLRGYIPVTGKINGHPFSQTLVPVKDSPYRLYVNMQMLKGGRAKVGDTVAFTLKQDRTDRKIDYKMIPALKKQLISNKLVAAFDNLTASRKKDILKYLRNIRTEETLKKDIDKVIGQLRSSGSSVKIP